MGVTCRINSPDFFGHLGRRLSRMSVIWDSSQRQCKPFSTGQRIFTFRFTLPGTGDLLLYHRPVPKLRRNYVFQLPDMLTP